MKTEKWLLCFKVDVHKMAKNRKVLYKQYASTEKNIEVPKHFMAFLRTLVIALTIHVRIMCVCCCPGRYLPSIKEYSQHYEICTLLKRDPRREIDCVVQMNICALGLIIVEHDPVDFYPGLRGFS